MRHQLIAIAGVVLLVAASAAAHHNFDVEFDWKKPVTLTGTFAKLEWANPHSYLFVDVKDPDGTMTQWKLEMGSPEVLSRGGWSKDMLKAGDQVTVDAWLAKNQKNLANVKSVMLSDGRVLPGGSSILDMKKKSKADSN